MFAFAQEDRRYGSVHFADLVCGQVLTNDRHTSADSDVIALGRFFRVNAGNCDQQSSLFEQWH